MSAIQQLTERVRARRELPAPVVRRVIRQAAGVSLDDVGRAVGVSRQAVSLWEKGSRTPRGENLTAYVSVLHELQRAVL
jgi:DNA-binding transcriptional regulator YiaG